MCAALLSGCFFFVFFFLPAFWGEESARSLFAVHSVIGHSWSANILYQTHAVPNHSRGQQGVHAPQTPEDGRSHTCMGSCRICCPLAVYFTVNSQQVIKSSLFPFLWKADMSHRWQSIALSERLVVGLQTAFFFFHFPTPACIASQMCILCTFSVSFWLKHLWFHSYTMFILTLERYVQAWLTSSCPFS